MGKVEWFVLTVVAAVLIGGYAYLNWPRPPRAVVSDPPNVQTFGGPRRTPLPGAGRATTTGPATGAGPTAAEPNTESAAIASLPLEAPRPGVPPRGSASSPDGPASGAGPVSPRETLFLSGATATWSRTNAALTAPLRVRAGGRVELGADGAGPEGIGGLRATAQGRAQGRGLLLPSAPYLSLIGRVCSSERCSAPFVVGSRALLCPSVIGVDGQLELWTNGRVSVARGGFSAATGGFHVYVEAAPASACSQPAGAHAVATDDAMTLGAGRTLDRPEFVISSSQSAWKPFFLPLDRPIRVRASGLMRPSVSAKATGPEGIVVSDATRWVYPGSALVIDRQHPLFAPALPYQALIGRLCGASGCGLPFFVGTERTICAPALYQDRIDFSTNHVIEPPTLLALTMPLSMEIFGLQARDGEYRFTVSTGAPSACTP